MKGFLASKTNKTKQKTKTNNNKTPPQPTTKDGYNETLYVKKG